MKRLTKCGESVEFRAKTSNVVLAKGSDGFELTRDPKSDPKTAGYSINALGEGTFKV